MCHWSWQKMFCSIGPWPGVVAEDGSAGAADVKVFVFQRHRQVELLKVCRKSFQVDGDVERSTWKGTTTSSGTITARERGSKSHHLLKHKCLCNPFWIMDSKTVFENVQNWSSKPTSRDTSERFSPMHSTFSVTRKKLPNVYKSCPKMISREKW